MASALDTIAHVVLPNLMKLKGASTLVGAMERRDVSLFAQVWSSTGVEHTPQVMAKELEHASGSWRIGVMSLPKPNEMGEAYMCAFVAKKNDTAITRYFTLEYDYVLATKTTRTLVAEREGNRTTKHGEGPALKGDFMTDASAFIDAILEIMSPNRVTPGRSYS
jgi:hypothetical protein